MVVLNSIVFQKWNYSEADEISLLKNDGITYS